MTEVQEQEIDFDQTSVNENLNEAPLADPEAPTVEQPIVPPKVEDVVDILKPKADPKTWTIGQGDYQRTYVQRKLSFMGKMEWFSLVGDVLDKALSGENKMSMNGLLSAPAGRDGTLSMSDFMDADTFMQALGKLLSYAPEFLLNSYVIWLGVPDREKDLAKQILALPEEDGGLTDEQGIEIIEIFIDQNYDALDDFFRERLGRLRRRVNQRQEAAKASRQSRP